jgi:5-methylcytosine-specific restriction endonuclease McrA
MKVFILRAFLISGLRRISYRFPPRTQCMQQARVERGKYRCAHCKSVVGRQEVQVDHVEPVIDPAVGFPVTETGADDWNSFIARLLPARSGWQVLCKPCHHQKSAAENARRKKPVAKKKPVL